LFDCSLSYCQISYRTKLLNTKFGRKKLIEGLLLFNEDGGGETREISFAC